MCMCVGCSWVAWNKISQDESNSLFSCPRLRLTSSPQTELSHVSLWYGKNKSILHTYSMTTNHCRWLINAFSLCTRSLPFLIVALAIVLAGVGVPAFCMGQVECLLIFSCCPYFPLFPDCSFIPSSTRQSEIKYYLVGIRWR